MQSPRGNERLQLQAMEGELLPERQEGRDHARATTPSGLATVEINNTFYRMPKTSVARALGRAGARRLRVRVEGPAAHHPHEAAQGRGRSRGHFLETAAILGRGLGPVFFQLPPNLQKDVARLRDFLALLPAGRPVAFEFRHETWFDDEVYEALRERVPPSASADTDDSGEAVRPSCPPPAGAISDSAAPTTTTRPCARGSTASGPSPGSARSCSSSTKTRARGRPWPRDSSKRWRGPLGRISRPQVTRERDGRPPHAGAAGPLRGKRGGSSRRSIEAQTGRRSLPH